MPTTRKPVDKTLLPTLLEQNPAPVEKPSQDRIDKIRTQVDHIMEVFLQVLPSNYVSQVQGPIYTMQFQAAAEQIAAIQIAAQESFADTVYDYTRSEFLYKILGALVFPDAQQQGYPEISGDITYRQFLKQMVILLLQGATKDSIKDGVELLTDATVEVIERAVAARLLEGGRSAWTEDDQHTFEINVSNFLETIAEDAESGLPSVEHDLYGFPEDPFRLQKNVTLVLRALKPAHTLYDYRHLFKDAFGDLFTDTYSWEMDNYYYQDFRRFWLGAEKITGTAGETLTDRSLFQDTSRDFTSISAGATLQVLTGPNSQVVSLTDEGHVGQYRVREVLTFPVGADTTARVYTTSGGLTGSATVEEDVLVDVSQDWSQAAEGEVLTLATGPNAGTYRLKTVLGPSGGPVGEATGPGTRVRVAPCLLRIERRMAVVATGQGYEVTVDRLGVQQPQTVVGEDVSVFFLR